MILGLTGGSASFSAAAAAMSKARSVSNADMTPQQMRSPASNSNLTLMQQANAGPPLAQRDTPVMQQKASLNKVASTPSSQQQQMQQMQQMPSQAPMAFAPLHSCPGPELVDEWWSGDELSDDDDDDEEGVSLLTPPLIPPFRFAMVECSRPESVGGPSSGSGNSGPNSSPANASSSQSQMHSASSNVGSPHTQQFKSIKSNASLSSLSTVSSSSSIASLAGSAAPSPSHAAPGTPGPQQLVRRSSLNNSIPINLAALVSATQRSAQQTQQQQQAQSQPNAAAASGSVSANAGLPMASPPQSGPASPSRALGSGVSGSAAAVASASGTAPSAPTQLPPALASASHSGKHTCMRGLPDHSVYRGSYPTLKNLHFLARLGLRSIVSLTPEPPSADLKKFCRDGGFEPVVAGTTSAAAAAAAGSTSIAAISSSAPPASSSAASASSSHPTPIRLYHFPVAKWSPEKDGDIVSVTSAQMVQILPLLINTANLPAYVHCVDGCNTTGMVVACLRKLQCWSMLSIVSEFLRFTRDPAGLMTDAEKTFLDRFNHQGLGGGNTPSTAMVSTGATGGGANTAAASDVASSSSLVSSSKSSKTVAPTGPNLLLRIPASLPNWLWGQMHLAVHPLGIRIYDAHVPAFAALHAKQLAPIDLAAANTAPPTPASLATASAQHVHAGWRLLPALDGSDRPDPLATASSAVTVPDLPPPLQLDGDGSLWDGLQLVEPLSPVSAAGLLAGAVPETDKERKKRKKKEKEQEKKLKDGAATATSAAPASATGVVDPSAAAVGCCSGQPLDAPSEESVGGGGGGTPEFPTSLKKAPSAEGASKPKGSAAAMEGSGAAAALVATAAPSLPPSTHPSRSPTPASASALLSDAEAPTNSAATSVTSAATPAAAAAAAAAPIAAPAASAAPPVSAPAPAPAPAPSLLSHPGEFHSLADLDASQWGKTRSSLAADMLFHAGSFEIPGASTGTTAGEEGAGFFGSASKLPPRDLSLWPEDQFIEHPDDPDLTATRDEFDTDVSLLLASLALEGFTMNHKISRPMQLFHSDQGEA